MPVGPRRDLSGGNLMPGRLAVLVIANMECFGCIIGSRQKIIMKIII